MINAPDTNWDRLYLRVRSSPLGGDFPRERFIRTPIQVITDILEWLDSEEQRTANLYSHAIGNLGVELAAIAHGFAGGKGKKPEIQPKDFYPYPNWKPLTDGPSAGPSAETKRILGQVFRRRHIPPHVYTHLLGTPEGE